MTEPREVSISTLQHVATDQYPKFTWYIGTVPNYDAVFIRALTKEEPLISIHITVPWYRNFDTVLLEKIDLVNQLMEKLV